MSCVPKASIPDHSTDCISSFVIQFHKEQEVYFCGDLLSGTVELTVESSVQVNSVRVHFHGESVVYWREHEAGLPSRLIKDHVTHWDQLYTVYGKKLHEQGEDTLLEPGEHSFAFSTKIPDKTLPSSFEGRKGAVRYWVQAHIEKKGFDEERCKPFTILENIDINQYLYQSSVSGDVDKTVCCMCFRSGELYLAAILDRSGYCPGEAIAVSCRGRNRARRDMGGIKARLVQKALFSVRDKQVTHETIICAIGGNKIERGKTKVWENQLLKIPAIPPSSQLSSLIKVSYAVQITMVVPKGIDLQFQLPVTIGTVPQRFLSSPSCPQTRAVPVKCTDGYEHFNQSSAQFNFPLQTYTPCNVFVENFIFSSSLSPRLPTSKSNKALRQMSRSPSTETEPLIGRRMGNTYIST